MAFTLEIIGGIAVFLLVVGAIAFGVLVFFADAMKDN